MQKDISEKAAELFFKKVEEKNTTNTQRAISYKKILDEKNEVLAPIRKLLKQLVDSGVFVSHNAMYDPNSMYRSHAPQPLQVWEEESSPHWQPGNSIYIDHPALLEIAVTNNNQRKTEGLISIACGSEHPHQHLIRGPFYDPQEACMALAEFLSSSCIRIERPADLE